MARARAYVPVLVPLFVNLFRRADELATAMEAGAIAGARAAPDSSETTMRARDWITLAGGAAVFAVVAALL